MLPYDPDDDDLDFSPEAVAQEFANEIMRYLNESASAAEAAQRKAAILDTLEAALATYIFNPDANNFTRLGSLGAPSGDLDDA